MEFKLLALFEKLFKETFEEREMYPAIATRHGDGIPGMYNKGKKPIDEIFTSSTLNIEKAG